MRCGTGRERKLKKDGSEYTRRPKTQLVRHADLLNIGSLWCVHPLPPFPKTRFNRCRVPQRLSAQGGVPALSVVFTTHSSNGAGPTQPTAGRRRGTSSRMGTAH